MNGVIDVGGGLRGIFGAGVFDYCLEHGIHFDYCIGVSAGSANLASFLAGQKFRNYDFYTEYSMRKEYISLSNFLKKGSYVDLDYGYGDLSAKDGEYPLDYRTFSADTSVFKIVATEAETAEPVYFTKDDIRPDNFDPIKASSSVPVVNRPYVIDGVEYFDGGISDPIPFRKAFDDGCDRVAVILTRPRGERREPSKDMRLARLLEHRYPKAAEALANRSLLYNRQLDAITELERTGRVMIIAPDDIGHLKTLTRDLDQLKGLYRKGLVAAQALRGFVGEK
jgi:predicted patatin/cPLA2 family phospholipase